MSLIDRRDARAPSVQMIAVKIKFPARSTEMWFTVADLQASNAIQK